ncbi:IS4 family transposase [Planctomycetota bacterium]
MCNGIAAELDGMDLGDKRLNKRSRQLIEALSSNCEGSINAACDGWGDTIAAYRFFDNPAVEPERILAPHVEATKRRMKEHPVVLVIQDTTELDYTSHAPDDARHLNKVSRLGLYDHTHLAVTPDGLSLGVVGVEYFDREAESLGKARQRENLPIEEKESIRWLDGYRLASQLDNDCPETQVVSVADREADIYDIFVEWQENTATTDFIIRARIARSTLERDPDAGRAAYRKVRDEVAASELRTTRVLDLRGTPKRKARRAELEIRAIQVTVKPPHARSRLPVVVYNVVLMEEVNGPGDGTDVSWLLITSLPIDTVEDVLRVVDYYVARWTVEVFFRVFKTGCRVEEIQLEKLSRLKNCLAFYKIIAWRIMYLTYMNRECPSLPCDAVFDDCEWKPVWRVVTKTELPQTPPSLSEFMSLLARLGGYNNRAKEHPPGPQPIWIGLRRMTDFAIAWLEFGPNEE